MLPTVASISTKVRSRPNMTFSLSWSVARGYHSPRTTHRSPSRARMRLVITLLQTLRRHVRVNLRGRQAAVAEQFLHAANVGTMIQQMRREAMPQAVRAGARVQARLRKVLRQQPADAAGRQPR